MNLHAEDNLNAKVSGCTTSLLVDYSKQCARRVSSTGPNHHQGRRRRPSGGMVFSPKAPSLRSSTIRSSDQQEQEPQKDVRFCLSLKLRSSNHCRRQDMDDTTTTMTELKDLDEDVAAIFGGDYHSRGLNASSTHSSFGMDDSSSRHDQSSSLRSSSLHTTNSSRSQRAKLHKTLLRRKTLEGMDCSNHSSGSSSSPGGSATFLRKGSNIKRGPPSRRGELMRALSESSSFGRDKSGSLHDQSMSLRLSSSLHTNNSSRSQRAKSHKSLLRRNSMDCSNSSSSSSRGGSDPILRTGSNIKRGPPSRRGQVMRALSESNVRSTSNHNKERHHSIGETPLTLWTHSYHGEYPTKEINTDSVRRPPKKEHKKQRPPKKELKQQRVLCSIGSQTMINDQFAALEALLGNCRGPEAKQR